MLFVVKRVLGRNFTFTTARARGKTKKQETKLQDQYNMQKDVFKAYRKQVEKGSILRQFREEVFRKSQLNGDWQIQMARDSKEKKQLQKILNDDKQSMLSKTTEIEAKAIKHRSAFDQNSGRGLLSDYANYRPYDKVHPVINDRNMEEGEILEDTHVNENLYKYINKLSDDYQEKDAIKKIIKSFPIEHQGMNLQQYGKILQTQFNYAQRANRQRFQQFKLHGQQKYVRKKKTLDKKRDINRNWFKESNKTYEFTGVQKTADPWTGDDYLAATLSPKAVDTIYELYLQGWNVREISKRFGILPARTKFCVWVRAQLYHEVIPKLGVKYYLRGLRFQQRYNQHQTFCDYGLDLDQLSNNSILQEITEWNDKMLDAQRNQVEYQGAMMRLQKQNKFNKYQMVQVGTVGKENAKYRLKQWVIFRGKGSDLYFLKHKLLNPLTRAQKKFSKVYY